MSLIDELNKAQAEEAKVEHTPESQPESEVEKVEPAPSQEEPKAEEPEDSAVKKEIPFHKHPRWIRQQRELAELKAALEATKVQEKPEPVKPVEGVPAQFQRLFGEDTEAFKEWQAMLRAEARKEAEAVVETRQKAEEERKQQEQSFQQKAVQWAEDQFIELADETGVDLTDKASSERNQILDIIAKYGLYDENGLPRIKEANELRLALHPVKANEVLAEKKQVLAKTATKTSATVSKSDIMTPSKLKAIAKRGGVMSLINN